MRYLLPLLLAAPLYAGEIQGTSIDIGSLATPLVPDTTNPTLASALIDGDKLTLRWSESVWQGGSWDPAELTIDMTSQVSDSATTYVSGNGTTKWVFSVENAAISTDTVTLDFTGVAGVIEDSSGNSVATIVGGAMTNNTFGGPVNPGETGLLGWWTMDAEPAVDSSANGYDFTASAAGISTVAGKVGSAQEYGLSSGRFYYNADFPNDVHAGDFTAGGWVKSEDFGNLRVLSQMGATATDYHWQIGYSTSSDKFFAAIYSSSDGGATCYSVGAGTLSTWHYVVARRSGNSLALYVDGAWGGSVTYNGTEHAGDVDLQGNKSVSLASDDATVDELFFYDRALTDQEVEWVYNNGDGRSAEDIGLGGAPDTGNPGSANLLAWWSLDAASGTTAPDASTNGENGTLQPDANFRVTPGHVGTGAVDCDGSIDRVEIPDTATEGAGATNEITIVAWINPDVITSSTTIENTFMYTQQVIMRLEDNDKMECFVYDEGGTPQQLISSGWTENEWQQIVFTFDNTTMRIYRNGVEIASTTDHAGVGIGVDGPTLAACAIGANRVGAQVDLFDGEIDEPAVFDRALTATEITWLYNSGAGRAFADLSD